MDGVLKVLAAALVAGAASSAWADTLYVDAQNGLDAPNYGYSSEKPVKTIQRAIDMANAQGDTIVVAPGTYAPFNALASGGITIKSSAGAKVTIIDGEGQERCATFSDSYPMTIEGFTLKNGHANRNSPGIADCGGGVCHATVRKCIIVGCASDGSGGGAYGCEIYDTVISECTAAGDGGGMSRCSRAVDCVIYGNSAECDGGGVHCTDIARCIVSNNVAAALGGGIEIYGNYEISGCTICCNKAFAGGGAFTYGGTLRNCDIYGNEATATSQSFGNGISYGMTCGGGGVSGSNWNGGRSFANLYNCDIHDNVAVRGGGVMFERLYGCRVYANVAKFGGGGYSLWAHSSVIDRNLAEINGGGVFGGALYNCTVTMNVAGAAGGGVYTSEEDRNDDRLSVACYNSIVYGNFVDSESVESSDGYLGSWYKSCVGYLHSDLKTVKSEVLFKDPMFVNPDGRDYRLAPTSPCIDNGDNGHVETEFDFSGAARISNGTVDMGAYELVVKYTVKFSLNGVSGAAPAARTILEGSAIGDLPSVKVPSGKEFLGWFTAKSGGTKVTAKTVVNGDMTVYAQWADVYAVMFSANGGKTPEAERKVRKNASVGPLPKATRTGYKLKGWYTKKSGGTKIKASTRVTKNVTYYAQWTANKYKIKFNKNGGKGTMKTLAATYGKTVKLTANTFKRTGYKFTGWAKTKKGKVVYKNKAKVKNLTATKGKTVTLYAVWKKAKSSSVKAEAEKSAASAAGAKPAISASPSSSVPSWAVGTFYGDDVDTLSTITVSKTGKVSGKVLFAGGSKWTIVGTAGGQRIEAEISDADGTSAKIVFAINKKEDGGCRIESEDGSIWAERSF